MRKLKRYFMSKFTRRQRKRMKRIIRNAMIRGSVAGAMLMMVVPSQVMGGTKPAVIMCLLAAIYLTLFIGANYCIPYYDGHYHLWPQDPWDASNSGIDHDGFG